MKCPNCGTEVTNETTFCPSCNTQINNSFVNLITPENQNNQSFQNTPLNNELQNNEIQINEVPKIEPVQTNTTSDITTDIELTDKKKVKINIDPFKAISILLAIIILFLGVGLTYYSFKSSDKKEDIVELPETEVKIEIPEEEEEHELFERPTENKIDIAMGIEIDGMLIKKIDGLEYIEQKKRLYVSDIKTFIASVNFVGLSYETFYWSEYKASYAVSLSGTLREDILGVYDYGIYDLQQIYHNAIIYELETYYFYVIDTNRDGLEVGYIRKYPSGNLDMTLKYLAEICNTIVSDPESSNQKLLSEVMFEPLDMFSIE